MGVSSNSEVVGTGARFTTRDQAAQPFRRRLQFASAQRKLCAVICDRQQTASVSGDTSALKVDTRLEPALSAGANVSTVRQLVTPQHLLRRVVTAVIRVGTMTTLTLVSAFGA